MIEKSWAQAFSDHVFTRINEHIFAPLYSEKTNSRPNAPINVIVGALILKDFRTLRMKRSPKPVSLIFDISMPSTQRVLRISRSVNGR